jgi:mannan endo-1,4-beta-mannosidase
VRWSSRNGVLLLGAIVLLVALAVVSVVSMSSSGSGTIQASGTHLTLNGSGYQFTGVNAYEIATDWGHDYGCGGEVTDAQLGQLFSSLPPNSLVRFWAFQGTMATNPTTGQLDWGPLDRIFATAAAYHQRLIPTITDQGGTCDGDHWQDPSWYYGGFKDVFTNDNAANGGGQTPLSYWNYLQDLVNRYKSSPALGMWEPISEAEASTCPAQYQPDGCGGHQTCPSESDAAGVLRYFFDVVGGEIHALDPNHLVENGLLGGGQCGIVGSDYQYVSASPGVDVVSYHDYYGAISVGSDHWKALSLRRSQAAALHKPIIAGEVGIKAGTRSSCVSLAERNDEMASKERAQMERGLGGFLVWDWSPGNGASCSFDLGPADPMMQPGGAVGAGAS